MILFVIYFIYIFSGIALLILVSIPAFTAVLFHYICYWTTFSCLRCTSVPIHVVGSLSSDWWVQPSECIGVWAVTWNWLVIDKSWGLECNTVSPLKLQLQGAATQETWFGCNINADLFSSSLPKNILLIDTVWLWYKAVILKVSCSFMMYITFAPFMHWVSV